MRPLINSRMIGRGHYEGIVACFIFNRVEFEMVKIHPLGDLANFLSGVRSLVILHRTPYGAAEAGIH